MICRMISGPLSTVRDLRSFSNASSISEVMATCTFSIAMLRHSHSNLYHSIRPAPMCGYDTTTTGGGPPAAAWRGPLGGQGQPHQEAPSPLLVGAEPERRQRVSREGSRRPRPDLLAMHLQGPPEPGRG